MKRAWANRARTVETTATLQAFLDTRREFAVVDLLLIILRFGPVFGLTPLGYTNAACDVTWDGITYRAVGAMKLAKDAKVRQVIGVEVDELELVLDPWVTSTASSGELVLDVIPNTSYSVVRAAQHGLFDQATVERWRMILPAPPQFHTPPDLSNGAVLTFVGDIGDVEVRRSEITFSVRSRLDQLQMPLPRNAYQPSCLNQLYDTVCGLARTGSFGGKSFQATSTLDLAASTTIRPVLTTAPPQGDHYFDLGECVINGGPFIALRRSIRSQVGRILQLTDPFPPGVLTDGVSILLQRGCDKTLATCEARFGNRLRFRGFPFVPESDAAF